MADNDLIQLEINGNEIKARSGELLIEVAEANGIKIPRFCYHRKLSVSANCRMCLVEIENSPKPMPACATPVTAGMKVFTKSDKTIDAQKSVMEFLLINHPLDCPICDQGGECDLQDLSVSYGTDFTRFSEKKRIVKNKNLGPLVSTDMTRCIHCTRCVRFGKEIAGVVELGGIGRGEHMEIDTYVELSLSSELSGNIIDICPVGALTSKPFRYQARSWELNNTRSVAPHDALGSNVILQTINNKLVRVLPFDNEDINEVWLSDRDRFSYLGLASDDRVLNPMVRNSNGALETVDWDTALAVAAQKIKENIADNPDKLGAFISSGSTVEEMYLLKKILSSLDSDNIDYRLKQTDFSLGSDQIAPGLSCKIADVENMDSILLIGCDVQKEVPLLGHRVRKAANKGAAINALNPEDFNFNFNLQNATTNAEQMLDTLKAIAKNCASGQQDEKYQKIKDLNINVNSEMAEEIAAVLDSEKSLILLGQHALTSGNFAHIYSLARAIADLTGSEFGLIDIGANAAGAWAVGAVNHASGKSTAEMLDAVSGIILTGVELEQDASFAANEVLSQKDFVLSLTSFMDETTKNYADVVLPLAAFGETSGTFINMQGDWQSFKGALEPKGEARPGWKILRVLGNKLDIGGFDFMSSTEVLAETKAKSATDTAKNGWSLSPEASAGSAKPAAIYDTDALVRRSKPLQNTLLAAGDKS